MTPRQVIQENAKRMIYERTDLSVTSFCELNGINPTVVYRNGNRSGLRTDTIIDLCHALGCTPNDLMRGLYEEVAPCTR